MFQTFYGVWEKEVGIATKYIGEVRKGKKRRLKWMGEKKRKGEIESWGKRKVTF